MSCTSAKRVAREMSSLERREEGARSVMIDIRYMWSAMDSGCGTEKRRHPSRGVVFNRSRRWRVGIGEVGGGWVGGGEGLKEERAGGSGRLC